MASSPLERILGIEVMFDGWKMRPMLREQVVVKSGENTRAEGSLPVKADTSLIFYSCFSTTIGSTFEALRAGK
jgi:hypothetical protein